MKKLSYDQMSEIQGGGNLICFFAVPIAFASLASTTFKISHIAVWESCMAS